MICHYACTQHNTVLVLWTEFISFYVTFDFIMTLSWLDWLWSITEPKHFILDIELRGASERSLLHTCCNRCQAPYKCLLLLLCTFCIILYYTEIWNFFTFASNIIIPSNFPSEFNTPIPQSSTPTVRNNECSTSSWHVQYIYTSIWRTIISFHYIMLTSW